MTPFCHMQICKNVRLWPIAAGDEGSNRLEISDSRG